MLTLYSRDFGKIKALAKGARKPQARKAGHIELFMRSNFMFAEGKSIDIVTQAELVEPYTALRDDLVRTTYAAYAAELIDGLTPEADRDPAKYDLLSKGLAWLAEAGDVMLAARYFELRLLSLAGFQPQLFHCISCREPIEQQDQFFSAELGGILCPACRDADRDARQISASAVKILRHLQTNRWSYVAGLRLRGKVRRELESIMHFYLRHILERNLRSAEFLYRLRREAELFTDSSDQ